MRVMKPFIRHVGESRIIYKKMEERQRAGESYGGEGNPGGLEEVGALNSDPEEG